MFNETAECSMAVLTELVDRCLPRASSRLSSRESVAWSLTTPFDLFEHT